MYANLAFPKTVWKYGVFLFEIGTPKVLIHKYNVLNNSSSVGMENQISSIKIIITN